MEGRRVTTLDEIRAQTEPQVVEIPGFKAGTSINVKLRMVDLTPRLMELRIGNPLLAEAQKLAKEGLTRDEIAGRLDNSTAIREILSLFDEVAKEAMVEPTYVEIMAIHSLTFPQKLKIFECATGVGVLLPFRGE
ncbi:MAG: hypothetical protein DDT21_02628 [Syntrophomonadaceae bacterium]|nr:hypothetical protein [Bacillota bacterium]